MAGWAGHGSSPVGEPLGHHLKVPGQAPGSCKWLRKYLGWGHRERSQHLDSGQIWDSGCKACQGPLFHFCQDLSLQHFDIT